MFYIRYKLYSLNNAMLEQYETKKYAGKSGILAYYQSIWQNVVFCQLWHTESGFIYTIV